MRSRPSPAKEEADKEMIWIIYYNNTFLLSTLVYPETKGGRKKKSDWNLPILENYSY